MGGALIINTAVTFGSFLILFIGGMVVFWPDVPWGALMVATIGVNAVSRSCSTHAQRPCGWPWSCPGTHWRRWRSNRPNSERMRREDYNLFAISSSMTSVAPPPIEAILTSR